MKKASLTLVGSGIKFLSHLTAEAKAYIEQSDKVLYLVNEPAMKEWIEKSNPRAESLDRLYTLHPMRLDCYHEITNYILDILRQDQHVCVVLYGHPTVFAQPGLNAVTQAIKEGYHAKALPAVQEAGNDHHMTVHSQAPHLLPLLKDDAQYLPNKDSVLSCDFSAKNY